MANSLSVVGGKEIYDFDAGSLAQLQVRVTDLATGDGVPRHRVGFYIPAYRQGVSPGLLRMDDHSGGDGTGALGVDTDDSGYATVRIVAGSSRDKAVLHIVIDGAHDGNERISLFLLPVEDEPTRRVARLIIVAGDKQLAVVGGAPFSPLQVLALDGGNQAVEGARVRFSVSPGADTLLASADRETNAAGIAVAQLMSGMRGERLSVTATCGKAEPVVFNLALAPPVSQLELVAGPQSANVFLGNAVACQATLRTRDANPQQGWPYAHGRTQVPGGCLSLESGGNGVTDGDGALQPIALVQARRDARLGPCSVDFQVTVGDATLSASAQLTVIA
ncbi:hypothetical protein LQD23_13130 [Chromobacterium violaceum]|uniref:hypothetical protein n=1 Tax=Chromobacterium violaceum TaxID=536 RepID=UPI001E43F3A0|nr:hypothetical protein [Chromobacterium violaceum]MCD0493237.1 hypothetical protein [Chromobacterium violaceum]